MAAAALNTPPAACTHPLREASKHKFRGRRATASIIYAKNTHIDAIVTSVVLSRHTAKVTPENMNGNISATHATAVTARRTRSDGPHIRRRTTAESTAISISENAAIIQIML